MTIASLVLTDQNNAIGKNHLIFKYLPAYMDYFHDLTSKGAVLMGKTTFENVGSILKGKKNIVITRSIDFKAKGASVVHSIPAALAECKNEKKIYVIGGAGIFKHTLPLTTEIYRTCLKARFKADSYYPDIDTSEFELESAECIFADEKNRFDYCVEKWVRTKKLIKG